MLVDDVEYKCSKCGADGVKLWRQYNTFADRISLLCATCACKDQKVKINIGADGYHEGKWGEPSSFIGDLCPARPVDGTFWGHTSGTQESVDWWKSLPLRMDGV